MQRSRAAQRWLRRSRSDGTFKKFCAEEYLELAFTQEHYKPRAGQRPDLDYVVGGRGRRVLALRRRGGSRHRERERAAALLPRGRERRRVRFGVGGRGGLDVFVEIGRRRGGPSKLSNPF